MVIILCLQKNYAKNFLNKGVFMVYSEMEKDSDDDILDKIYDEIEFEADYKEKSKITFLENDNAEEELLDEFM